jgi:hypothetical protein
MRASVPSDEEATPNVNRADRSQTRARTDPPPPALESPPQAPMV